MPKKPNWAEIKKRYLKNDKPAEIAADYGITSKQVRDKAYREGWGAEKATLCDEISTKLATEIKTEVAARVEHQLLGHFDLMATMDDIVGEQLLNIKAAMANMGAFQLPGELAPNDYHKETNKQATKYYFEMKKQAAKNQPTGEKPGINIIAPEPPPADS